MSIQLYSKFKTKWLQVLTAYRVRDKKSSVEMGNLDNIPDVHAWDYVSRKKDPIVDISRPDAVVIVPIVKTLEGNKICVTEEFRIPINDYEWGFPAGLIEPNETLIDSIKRELKEETGLQVVRFIDSSLPIYSSAGLTDESVIMAFVECEGEITNANQEETEDIKPHLLDIGQVKDLLSLNGVVKMGAKAWGILSHFARIGEIEWKSL